MLLNTDVVSDIYRSYFYLFQYLFLVKIQLISYIDNLSGKKRIEKTAHIINNSKADLVLFSGHTILYSNDLIELQNEITNSDIVAILEVKSDDLSKFLSVDNSLYCLKNGKITSLATSQLFTDSEDIIDNYRLGERLLTELETRRTFKVKRKQITILQCGEINILENKQTEGNKPHFRLLQYEDLAERFQDIVENTKIFLNPIHSPMGNQGKMEERRKYLSKKERFYFSTCNNNKLDLSLKSLQYAFYNGERLVPTIEFIEKDQTYISRIFEI